MARGTVYIDIDRCKGCGLCITACPKKVLRVQEDGYSVRGYRPVELVDPEGQCTGCALCALMCPDVALTVYRFVPGNVPAAPEPAGS